MKKSAKIIVVGLGIVGSSITSHLAQQGYQVAGFDMFKPPHAYGSSHGENRLFRRTPAEGDEYAFMAAESYKQWIHINDASNRPLFLQSGCIDIGDETTLWAEGSVNASNRYGGDTVYLSHNELIEKFPGFKFNNKMTAAYSPSSGHIQAENSVQYFLDNAHDNNAKLKYNTKIKKLMHLKKQ